MDSCGLKSYICRLLFFYPLLFRSTIFLETPTVNHTNLAREQLDLTQWRHVSNLSKSRKKTPAKYMYRERKRMDDLYYWWQCQKVIHEIRLGKVWMKASPKEQWLNKKRTTAKDLKEVVLEEPQTTIKVRENPTKKNEESLDSSPT